MRMPVIEGVIARRILANWRADPAAVAALLPTGLRPLTVRGHAIAGVCLIRLERLRPRGLPALLGVAAENAAHRVAVAWDQDGVERSGVWIPRRDSGSRLVVAAGGRIFPGVHQRARFRARASASEVEVEVQAADGAAVLVAGRVVDALPPGSVFADLAEASAFFARGAVGWSPGREPGRLEGLELACRDWRVDALAVDRASSSWIAANLPGAAFDCALLMRGIAHEWHDRGVRMAEPACGGCAVAG